MSSDSTPPPVQPARCRVRVERLGRDLELYHSQRHLGVALFLAAFLTAWSAGCATAIGAAIRQGDPFMWLLATPFLAAWCFLVWILQQSLFGWERLRIGPSGLVHEQRGMLGVRRRELPLSEVQSFAAAMTTGGEDQSPQSYIRIRTLGKPVAFAKGVSEREVRWLVELLQSHTSVLRGDEEPMDEEDEAEVGVQPLGCQEDADPEAQPSGGEETEHAKAWTPTSTRSLVEVLEPARQPLEPPSDCGYTLRQGFDGLHFERRGRWSLAAIAAITLINAFWNGIVGVFVWQLCREFQWFLCLFLVPFELVGLMLVLLWIGAVFAPAFLNVWSFGGYEISCRTSFFGFGATKRYPVTSLDRIELHEYVPARPGNGSAVDIAGKLGDFSLSFVTRDGQELVEIKRLTEGEARWMADAVYRNFSMWFPRR